MKIDIRERFTLRMPAALYQKVQKEADIIGISLNALILQILWDWLKEQERKEQPK